MEKLIEPLTQEQDRRSNFLIDHVEKIILAILTATCLISFLTLIF